MSSNIATSLRKVATGCDFATAAAALGEGMHNISSHELRPGGEFDQFLEKEGLTGTPVVLMAHHSMGGRNWRLADGKSAAFYAEPLFSGGWSVLTDENATVIHLESLTSGTNVTAAKESDGTWTVTLEAPVDESGQPYRGCYWKNFHGALGLEAELVKEAE